MSVRMRAGRYVAALLVSATVGSGCVVSEHEDGVGVSISLLHEDPPGAAGVWSTASGARVLLEHAFVTVTEIELVPCADKAGARHGIAAPARLATPIVEDLLGASGDPHLIGTLSPPAHRYCGLRVTAGPADEDALGVTNPDDVVGLSGLMDGQVEDPSGARALFTTCTASASFELTLVDATGQPAPFELSEEKRHVDLDLAIDAAQMLDGLDVSAGASTDGLSCEALANLVRSIHRVDVP